MRPYNPAMFLSRSFMVVISIRLVLPLVVTLIKGECSVFLKKNIIIDENDSLSEYSKIPLGHNLTNGAVYSKMNFKVEISSALQLFDSHPPLLFQR